MLGLNLASCGLIFETRKYPGNFQTRAKLSTLNTSLLSDIKKYIYHICIDVLKNFNLFQVSYEIGKTLVGVFKVIMKLYKRLGRWLVTCD